MSENDSNCDDKYVLNQEVLVRWSDGLFYLGHITKVITVLPGSHHKGNYCFTWVTSQR